MPDAGDGMRVIEAAGFTLEPQVASHAEALFEVLVDPAIYAYENEPPPSVEWLRIRFTKLESRRSPDGSEHWLNWVLRLPEAGPIGYVQATVYPDGHADIAYVLSSAHWGRGHASRAVDSMIGELREHYGVRALTAVFKRDNLRSRRLLERLGFTPALPGEQALGQVEAGEVLMQRACSRA